MTPLILVNKVGVRSGCCLRPAAAKGIPKVSLEGSRPGDIMSGRDQGAKRGEAW